MRTVGIIAEYNPFHNGHLYQLNHIRKELQADYIVVAMSGDYVQRGTPALLSKHVRTDMALSCGADLVLEIPVSFSSASAEYFAGGGVQLLDTTGVVNMLCFGAETDNLPLIKKIASVLHEEPLQYKEELRQNLRQGLSYPAARSQALDTYFSGYAFPEKISSEKVSSEKVSSEELRQILKEPNNILGTEYCRALLRQKSSIRPYALKRSGAAFHETSLTPEKLPSATAIRSTVARDPADVFKQKDSLKQSLPAPAWALLEDCMNQNAFLLESDFDLLLHYCLLSQEVSALSQYADVSEHLARRIRNCLNQYEGFSRFTALLKSKELTYSHIQRGLLHILLQIREIPPSMPYIRVLGFRKESTALLHEIKKRASLPLIVRMADAPSVLDEKQLKFFHQNTFASNLYESVLCKKAGRPFVHEYQKQLVIR